MAWQQNGAIQMIQRELAAHSAATQPLRDEISALKWQIERQTEIQRQMCVMQARSQRLSTDVCWQRWQNTSPDSEYSNPNTSHPRD